MANIPAKTIQFPGINNTYKFLQGNETLPELTAGNILSESAYTKDTTPYLYRAMPYVSKRLEESLVGGSVVWNQLKNISSVSSDTINGVTFTNNGDGSITVNGTATGGDAVLSLGNFSYTSNGVFLFCGCPKGGSLSTYYFGWASSGDTGDGVFTNVSNYPASIGNRIYVKEGTTVSNLKFWPMVRNITQLIGSTIANDVYTLETNTTGAGIAWLRKYFPTLFTYNSYDTGTIKSVEATAHVTTGKNLFNKSDYTYIDGYWSGGVITETSGRRIVYIPCLPNTTYTASRLAVTSDERFYLGYTEEIPSGGGSVYSSVAATTSQTVGNKMSITTTTGANARYLVCWAYWGNHTEALDTLQLQLGTTATPYEPYEEHTYDLGDVTLRGIPKLVNNELVYDGDIYKYTGAVTRKYGVVDLGTLTWNTADGNGWSYASLQTVGSGSSVQMLNNFICDKYSSYAWNFIIDGGVAINAQGTYVAVRSKGLANATAAAFKTAMSGVYLVYELATPTTETTTPFEQYQVCETGGTEEYTTSNDVPVGHETKYYTDLAKKLVDLPFDMSMIAPVEVEYKATRNYSVGDYLIVNNTFYKVTSSIANGGTITPNTNVTATTVATELIALR